MLGVGGGGRCLGSYTGGLGEGALRLGCSSGALLGLVTVTAKETYKGAGREGAGLTAIDRGKFLPVLWLIKCLWPTYCTTFPERPQKAVLGWQGQMELMEPSLSALTLPGQPVGLGLGAQGNWGGGGGYMGLA